MSSRWIFVTFQVEGFHYWPDAIKYPQHSYLSFRHRHIFHFRVQLELVGTSDREIEFIELKRKLLNRYASDYPHSAFEFRDQSCESIAGELAGYLYYKFPNRRYKIEVSEDGENGAIVET